MATLQQFVFAFTQLEFAHLVTDGGAAGRGLMPGTRVSRHANAQGG